MKATEAHGIFLAMAAANRHPDPAAYADVALEHWKSPGAAPAAPEVPVDPAPAE